MSVPPLLLPQGAATTDLSRGQVENLAVAVDPGSDHSLCVPRSRDSAHRGPILHLLDPRGRARPAVDSLRRAPRAGFTDGAPLAGDRDFERVRPDADFRGLAARRAH